jgi:hypothetical protein
LAKERLRNLQVKFRVTEEERDMLRSKMELSGIRNMRLFILKMVFEGVVVNLDLSCVSEMTPALGRSLSLINQIAKRANQTGRVYESDLNDIRERCDAILDGVKKILDELSAYK